MAMIVAMIQRENTHPFSLLPHTSKMIKSLIGGLEHLQAVLSPIHDKLRRREISLNVVFVWS